MNTTRGPSALKLAASLGALSPQLATLLALQRAEEPETPVLLTEVQPDDLFNGLENGCYDLGVAWAALAEPPLTVQPLWRDELAVAMPVRSPLLAHSTIPSEVLRHYPLFYWRQQDCETLNLQADGLRQIRYPLVGTAISFELMTVLVAAGYGIGIAPRSRIVQARSLGIVMRPLAEGPHWIGTDLFWSVGRVVATVERFVMRARRVAERDHHPVPPSHVLHCIPHEPQQTDFPVSQPQ
jgi:DNA-binding transcriptional LysR family regulator